MDIPREKIAVSPRDDDSMPGTSMSPHEDDSPSRAAVVNMDMDIPREKIAVSPREDD
eukprot:CAMPEP_0194414966 /NCGR_PEP_ID=MMETSP0176-20130528/13714_1 /TAXON_ID=216777 /ORGANISM="Proboscia alata, Strain PI-D3" /LENGTH=56 /DNA_ID=CAMNT_0039219333 /DNA_START=1 /DNA_END=168 /DNA_ORIENTATION=-